MKRGPQNSLGFKERAEMEGGSENECSDWDIERGYSANRVYCIHERVGKLFW